MSAADNIVERVKGAITGLDTRRDTAVIETNGDYWLVDHAQGTKWNVIRGQASVPDAFAYIQWLRNLGIAVYERQAPFVLAGYRDITNQTISAEVAEGIRAASKSDEPLPIALSPRSWISSQARSPTSCPTAPTRRSVRDRRPMCGWRWRRCPSSPRPPERARSREASVGVGHEPRHLKLTYFVCYIVVLGTGFATLVRPPQSIEGALGAPLTAVWAGFLIMGAFGASSPCSRAGGSLSVSRSR